MIIRIYTYSWLTLASCRMTFVEFLLEIVELQGPIGLRQVYFTFFRPSITTRATVGIISRSFE